MDRGTTLTILGIISLPFPFITWQTFLIPLLLLIFGIGYILYDKKQLEEYSPKA